MPWQDSPGTPIFTVWDALHHDAQQGTGESPVTFWTGKDCHLCGIFSCSEILRTLGVLLVSCVMQWKEAKGWKCPTTWKIVMKSFQGRQSDWWSGNCPHHSRALAVCCAMGGEGGEGEERIQRMASKNGDNIPWSQYLTSLCIMTVCVFIIYLFGSWQTPLSFRWHLRMRLAALSGVTTVGQGRAIRQYSNIDVLRGKCGFQESQSS